MQIVPYLYNQCMTLQTSPGESNCKCLERDMRVKYDKNWNWSEHTHTVMFSSEEPH